MSRLYTFLALAAAALFALPALAGPGRPAREAAHYGPDYGRGRPAPARGVLQDLAQLERRVDRHCEREGRECRRIRKKLRRLSRIVDRSLERRRPQPKQALQALGEVEQAVSRHCQREGRQCRGLFSDIRELDQSLRQVRRRDRRRGEGRWDRPERRRPPTDAPAYRHPGPMAPRAFAAFYGEVQRNPFDNQRLELIRIQAQASVFTANQSYQLLQLFVFDNHRLDALEVLAGRIVDPQNTHGIPALFTFFNHQRAARALLVRYS